MSLLAILLLVSGVAHAVDDGISGNALQQMLERAGNGTDPEARPCPECDAGQRGASAPMFTHIEAADWDSSKLCHPPSAEAFCQQVVNACMNGTRSMDCSAFQPEEEGARFSDEKLRQKIFRHAREYLEELRSDPELLSTCCGESRKCRDSMSATGITVLAGLGPRDSTAYFDRKTNTIDVSEGALLSEKTEQSLETTFIHELGHSCQFARQGESLNGCLESEKAAKATSEMFDLTLGAQARQCVARKLAAEASAIREQYHVEVCMGAWLQEAFANAIFVGRRKDLAHWARPCTSPGNIAHARPVAYLECLMEGAPFRKQYCGEKK